MKLTIIGKEMLALYFREPYKKLKGSEVPFTIPLVNPSTGEDLGVNLEGFFDLVEADDTIVEFKTSAQVLSAMDISSHLQLTAYGYAFQILHGKPPRGFKLINFIKNKKTQNGSHRNRKKQCAVRSLLLYCARNLEWYRQGSLLPKNRVLVQGLRVCRCLSYVEREWYEEASEKA